MSDTDVDEALSATLMLLTLITGDEWTKQKAIDQADALQKHAEAALVRQGMTAPQAVRTVADRFAGYRSHDPVILPTTQAVDENKLDELAGSAVPPTPEELRGRASEYFERRRQRREEG